MEKGFYLQAKLHPGHKIDLGSADWLNQARKPATPKAYSMEYASSAERWGRGWPQDLNEWASALARLQEGPSRQAVPNLAPNRGEGEETVSAPTPALVPGSSSRIRRCSG